jgi:hypothetical protein
MIREFYRNLSLLSHAYPAIPTYVIIREVSPRNVSRVSREFPDLRDRSRRFIAELIVKIYLSSDEMARERARLGISRTRSLSSSSRLTRVATRVRFFRLRSTILSRFNLIHGDRRVSRRDQDAGRSAGEG